MTYKMAFDQQRSFELFTHFPASDSFPLNSGDHVLMKVILIPHPMQPWIRAELSASALWYATVRPTGQPDLRDLLGETILIEFERPGTPSQHWQLPWRVDQDEVLITLVDTPASLAPLAQFEHGVAIPARILLEVTEVTGLEIIPDIQARVWKLNLSPFGLKQGNLISSEVELLINR